LADLVEDKVESARSSIQIAEAIVSPYPFQTPQVFLWMARVRQLLYEGDFRQAYRLLFEHWPRLHAARVLNVNYYAWVLYNLRVCCDLACMSVGCPEQAKVHADALWCIAKMRRFSESVFRTHASALGTVVHAHIGRTVTDDTWNCLEKNLHAADLKLLAIAVRWHRGIYTAGAAGEALRSDAMESLRSQGCADPKRLMNVILPGPASPPQ
jgi:hypothetical protein